MPLKPLLKKVGMACGCVKKEQQTAEQGVDRLRAMAPVYDEHRMTVAQIADRFKESRINAKTPTSSKGLTDSDAKRKLEEDGKNLLTPPKGTSMATMVIRCYFNLFAILLLFCSLLSLIVFIVTPEVLVNLYLAIILIVVVIVNGSISLYEEKKAMNVVAGFNKLLPEKCTVFRDGAEQQTQSENLVVGDLVWIRSGTKVPADVRLVYSAGVKLETASITGECEPLEYGTEEAASNVSVFDAHNVAFNSSMCFDGEALGVIIRTGDHTMIGKIANLTTSQETVETKLAKEIAYFMRFICISSFVLAIAVFAIAIGMAHAQGNLDGPKVRDIFINGFLVILVANVPQGLPSTVTSLLTIVARRMAKKNVYVKRLELVETFGAATLVASDKTGTLTKNDMTVTDLWYNCQYTTGTPDVKQRTLLKLKQAQVNSILDYLDAPIPMLLTVMTVCNKAVKETVNQYTERRKSIYDRRQSIVSGATTPEKSARRGSLTGSTSKRESISAFPSRNLGSVENGGMSPPPTSKQPAPLVRRMTRQMSIVQQGEAVIRGNPSETALLRFVEKLLPCEEIRDSVNIVFEIPFNSVRKWHLTITKKRNDVSETQTAGNVLYTVMMKGAPEVLIQKCTQYAMDDGNHDLSPDFMLDFHDAYLRFGNEGRRLIGFCYKTFEAPEDIEFNADEKNFPMAELIFIGMAAIMDPPRDDTKSAIAACKTAGIKVFMVTGDHPLTAASIARQIGLLGEPAERIRSVVGRGVEIEMGKRGNDPEEHTVIHGEQLERLTPEQWDEILEKRYGVFARTTPEQKLYIVEQCQKRGEIVAVTGDGVNDAPALKRADIGVAMGGIGTDVAKQAADIVLMDDNFASIVRGIEEGRLIFDNMRKTIAYTLTHLMPEIVPIILNLIVGFPLALTSLQIVSIDLGTELGPAISIAYEPPEHGIMQQMPRRRTTKLVNKNLLVYSYLIIGVFSSAACFYAYHMVYQYNGIPTSSLPLAAHSNYFTESLGVNETFCFHNTTQYYGHEHTYDETNRTVCIGRDEQLRVAAQSTAAWHLTLVLGQFFHLWMCQTRRMSFFRHGITNLVCIFAVISEICLIIILVYCPGVQTIMGALAPPGIVWIPCLFLGAATWIFNELRKLLIRNYPKNIVARALKW